MEVKAESRYLRISAFKARNTTRHIQGMGVGEAMDILRFSPQKAAGLVAKTLKTAIANAEHNNALEAENLFIKEAVVGEGPTFKRFRPRARGGAGSIRKRTSHIRIILAEREEEPKKAKKESKKPAAKKRAATKAKAETTVKEEKKES